MMDTLNEQLNILQAQYETKYASLEQWYNKILAKGTYYNTEQDNSIVEKTRFMEAQYELLELEQQIAKIKAKIKKQKWEKFLSPKHSEILASKRILEILCNLQSHLAGDKSR